MKKLTGILLIICMILTAGCSPKPGEPMALVDDSFLFYSLPWGEAWENLQETEPLSAGKVIKEDGHRIAVEIENAELLGVSGKAVVLFIVSEDSYPALGLTDVYFAYEDADEEALLSAGEKLYGERKAFFLDKNGIENPLNPPAWYSEEMLESTLTEAERESYSALLAGVEESRADAIMRGPLVVISVDEDNNTVRFIGDKAAEVRNLREEGSR